MDSIKPGELLVGGSNLFIRGGPGDVKKVVELIIHRLAILLRTKIWSKYVSSLSTNLFHNVTKLN
jgi:hypothetical protein